MRRILLKPCKYCGKIFEPHYSSPGKYCGMSCRGFDRKQTPDIRVKISLSLIGNKRALGYKHTKETKKLISIKGKAHYKKHPERRREQGIRNKNSSKETRKKISLANSGKRNGNWRGGKSFEVYPPSFNKQLKERVRVRDNFICQLCGIPELEFDYSLCVHHIDYDKNNNIINNLICLCSSCHMKTNFNREKWSAHFIGEIIAYVSHP